MPVRSSGADRPVHELIDSWLPERALVVGSLPPDGRDLDLLVRPAAELALTRALSDAHFAHDAGGWLRFAHGTVEQVDVIASAEWGLPEDELDSLLRNGVPLTDGGCLARPAPHHVLLILARQLAANGELAPGRRARLQQAVAEDPRAWELAGAHAAAWGAERQLACLRSLAAGATPRRRLLRPAVLGKARRRLGLRKGCVIALSGLDGAGKSSQAQALGETLERLGYEVAVEWTRIGCNDRFWDVAVAVKSGLNRIAGIGSSGESAPADPVTTLRQRSRLLTHLWATAIALDDTRARRRSTRPHLRHGRVVICDRYTLDSIVALRCMIDARRQFAFERWLIRRLSPRPLRAFLLEVRPETAWERKREDLVSELRSHSALYREECRSLGVRLLDGERPRDELSAVIAADVWHALARS